MDEAFGVNIFFLILAILAFFLFTEFIVAPKSKKYRRELADMYVSAKIRTIAKEESLDLDIEKLNFNKWSKQRRKEEKEMGLDSVVEEELKEKISESFENKDKKSK